MRRCLILFSIAALFLLLPATQGLCVEQGVNIAAIVNTDAISGRDVDDRMTMLMASSGLPQTQEIRDKIRPQVIAGLIDEQIKLQEAKRLELKVTPEEIAQGFSTIAQQNKLTPQEFEEMIIRTGIKRKTMEDQIRAQLAWNKVIQTRIRPQITISDTDVDAFLLRLKESSGKTQFLLAEIFLPVNDNAQENDVRAVAERLASEIRAGKVPFSRVAQQFSQAAGAPQGGDLGWVQEGQMPGELEDAIKALQVNTISPPVRSLGGFHLFLLRDKRALTAENLPSREQVAAILGSERMERSQRRYLLDLRSAAFIDTRARSSG